MKSTLRIRFCAAALLLLLLPRASGEPGSVRAAAANFTFLPAVQNPCASALAFQPASDTAKEAETLRQINAQRSANGGLAPLAGSLSLVQIARFHSYDMAKTGALTHDGSAGESPWERFDWLCERYARMGEIIGWGFGGDVGRMMDWWMNSPGHRALILRSEFTLAGAGYVYLPGSQYGSYWTVNFATPAQPAGVESLSLHPLNCTTFTETSPEGGISATFCE